jgi:hypothetical protein
MAWGRDVVQAFAKSPFLSVQCIFYLCDSVADSEISFSAGRLQLFSVCVRALECINNLAPTQIAAAGATFSESFIARRVQ